MRTSRYAFLGWWAGALLLALPAPRAHALDVTFTDATGATTTIIDNGQGDNNPAVGVIDFRITLFGLNFTAFGRVEEVVAGPRKLVRITETPGAPPQGYYQNTSLATPIIITVTVNSTAFAAVPAGAAWTVNYAGSTFDGPFPGTRVPCPGNGTVTIPTHTVTGLLNGGAVALGTANGPVFINAAPRAFAAGRQGLTPAPARTLQLVWMLDPDVCDGIQLPSSAEVILEPGDAPPPDDPPPPPPKPPYGGWWMPGIVIVILLVLVIVWYARHRAPKERYDGSQGGIEP